MNHMTVGSIGSNVTRSVRVSAWTLATRTARLSQQPLIGQLKRQCHTKKQRREIYSMLSHYEGGQRGLMIATKSIFGVQHNGLRTQYPPSLSTPAQGTRGHATPASVPQHRGLEDTLPPPPASVPRHRRLGDTLPQLQYPGMGH